MFFEQLANSGSYNRIIAVNCVGRPSHRMWRRQHQNRRLLRLKSAIFLLKRRLRCCSEQLDWDRGGNEWDGYVAKGCTRALKTTRATDRSVYRNWWKNRQDPHILCVQLSFLWSDMLSRALASVASPNSPGAGLFTVFNNPCTNPKISFSQLLESCCLYLVRFPMLLTQTSNLLSDNAVLLPNRNIRVKCFYDKAKKIR